MSTPALMHHSGWPWPLTGVQDWFDGLWHAVADIPRLAAEFVWSIAPQPLKDFMTFLTDLTRGVWDALVNFFKDPMGTLKGAFDTLFLAVRNVIGWWDPTQTRFVGGFLGWLWGELAWLGNFMSTVGGWVWDQINPVLSSIGGAITDFPGWVADQITGGLGWLWGRIDAGLSTAWSSISNGLTWVGGEISAGVGWVAGEVKTMFDGAVAGVGAAIMDAVSGLGDVLGSAFQGTIDWFWGQLVPALGHVAGFLTETVLKPIWDGLQWLQNWIVLRALDMISGVENLFKSHSMITPADALALAPKVVLAAAGMGLGATAICSVAGIKIMGTGLPVGEIGSYIKDLVHPSMFISATLGTLLGVALITPLRYQYNKMFTPLIPPVVDLIRFVVREVITPETFYDLSGYHGFSGERAKWYWDAHWVLPAFTQLVDAYHRGVITSKDLDTFVVWHDYSPTKRPGITKTDLEIMRGILKRLIPRVDLRYAWELGRITDEELVAKYEALGYEEDSELMAEIQMARALVEEVHKVRDQWLSDFLGGFILEETLRANLAVIGIGPARIDYYVTYAKKRRTREHNKRLLDIYDDAYFKDLKTYEELETDATPLLVDSEALDLFLTEAYIRKYKKPKAD